MKKIISMLIVLMTMLMLCMPAYAADYPENPQNGEVTKDTDTEIPFAEKVVKIIIVLENKEEGKPTKISLNKDVLTEIRKAEKPVVIEVKNSAGSDKPSTEITISPEAAKKLKNDVNLTTDNISAKEEVKIEKALGKLDVKLDDVTVMNFTDKTQFGGINSKAELQFSAAPSKTLVAEFDAGKTIVVYIANLRTGTMIRTSIIATIFGGKLTFNADKGACYVFVAE